MGGRAEASTRPVGIGSGRPRAEGARLGKFKIPLDITAEQLLKTLLDYLATWEKVNGNDRNNPIILNDYYVKILDIWPTEPYV